MPTEPEDDLLNAASQRSTGLPKESPYAPAFSFDQVGEYAYDPPANIIVNTWNPELAAHQRALAFAQSLQQGSPKVHYFSDASPESKEEAEDAEENEEEEEGCYGPCTAGREEGICQCCGELTISG